VVCIIDGESWQIPDVRLWIEEEKPESLRTGKQFNRIHFACLNWLFKLLYNIHNCFI